jgi:hypothetical protein
MNDASRRAAMPWLALIERVVMLRHDRFDP